MTARVLVVDDVPANLKLLEARLSAEYFDVATCANGPDALKLCAAGACDIVLLDVMMPGMNGFEVCRRLKADPATAHIPVVLVTALDQAADRLAGLEAGADDLLTKPIDEIALLARLRSLSRLRLTIDELRTRSLRAAQLGINGPLATAECGFGGRVLVIDDRRSSSETIVNALSPPMTSNSSTTPSRRSSKALPAERIRVGIAREGFSLPAAKKALSVTVSMGLAESGKDAAELMRRADKGLYRSKEAGRNRVSVDAAPVSGRTAEPARAGAFEPLSVAKRSR